MPPTPQQESPAPSPVPSPVSVPRTPSGPIIKFVRIFLLVLIGLGLGLIATQNFWVPKFVNAVVPPPVVPTVTTSETNPTTYKWVLLSQITKYDDFVLKNDKIFLIVENEYTPINKQLVGADVETFEVLIIPSHPTFFSENIARDKNHVYVGAEVLEGADPITFAVLNSPEGYPSEYSKDKSRVYDSVYVDGIAPIKKADPESFVVLQSSEYAKDKNYVYSYGHFQYYF